MIGSIRERPARKAAIGPLCTGRSFAPRCQLDRICASGAQRGTPSRARRGMPAAEQAGDAVAFGPSCQQKCKNRLAECKDDNRYARPSESKSAANEASKSAANEASKSAANEATKKQERREAQGGACNSVVGGGIQHMARSRRRLIILEYDRRGRGRTKSPIHTQLVATPSALFLKR